MSSWRQPIKRAAALALVATLASCALPPRPERDEALAPAPRGARPPGELRLIEWSPPQDAPLEPSATFVLVFDHALAPDSARAGGVRLEYVGTPATFLMDPFRATSIRLADDGRSILVDPPDLLPGSTVRLVVTSLLRDAWGEALPAPAQATPRGDERAVLTYRVLELPPPR